MRTPSTAEKNLQHFIKDANEWLNDQKNLKKLEAFFPENKQGRFSTSDLMKFVGINNMSLCNVIVRIAREKGLIPKDARRMRGPGLKRKPIQQFRTKTTGIEIGDPSVPTLTPAQKESIKKRAKNIARRNAKNRFLKSLNQ